ncbi:hypothetical protein [Lelliottia sp. WAP21]|uniref:hypothetical protein n=1 Tax=Lelliottia sp. WAP21 TaxID=2877426 RepID=UPI001E417D55|nr:hypothetical protein [Lelliottia sp. WAP21]
MNVTYHELCNKFKIIKNQRTTSEKFMIQEIELLFITFKESLSMHTHSYTRIINQRGAFVIRQSEQVERVTYRFVNQLRDIISQCVVDEHNHHGIMFNVEVGVGSDPVGPPEAIITLKCKISPLNGDLYTIKIEESDFNYYPSSATNRFDEVCVAMKYYLLNKINC